MRILFTGGSSFTGFWFVRELFAAGHRVVAIFRRSGPEAYGEGVRAQRVRLLQNACTPVFGCSFGGDTFLEALQRHGPWNLFCHHAAEATNYRDPSFDVIAALSSNTHNAGGVVAALAAVGCRRFLLTGSIFEGGEGAGSQGVPHCSPYGLSKALTAETFRYHTHRAGMRLGKFVIPNPFGPHEEARFTSYLARSWFERRKAVVRTPAYVRDNIHVSLLAKAYVRFGEGMTEAPGFEKLNPSGYVESQGVFAQRFADEMRPRLSLPCELELQQQTEFPEPHIRINTDPLDAHELGWDEGVAWDELSGYYRDYLSAPVQK